nr:sushi, nidogen and EGF-like domain-containing protein 1 [Misgurnus anguillicaudatus]
MVKQRVNWQMMTAESSVLWVLLFVTLQCSVFFILGTGLFYPFGTGDTVNDRSDDGSSAAISLLQPFIFFGHTYNKIYVNNNGHLTFDAALDSYIPYSFPGYGLKDIIAPFWTDFDNSLNGVISYQQYTSGSVLTQATQDMNQYFPDLSFSASWVFVATWDRVPYYSHPGNETSFQVVLISNGNFSFVLINYGTIAPSQQIVQAGYDTINSSYYFSITKTLQDFTSLKYSSNVNVSGRWAFRTDHGQGFQFNGWSSWSPRLASHTGQAGLQGWPPMLVKLVSQAGQAGLPGWPSWSPKLVKLVSSLNQYDGV